MTKPSGNDKENEPYFFWDCCRYTNGRLRIKSPNPPRDLRIPSPRLTDENTVRNDCRLEKSAGTRVN